jgi:hypothetical protein
MYLFASIQLSSGAVDVELIGYIVAFSLGGIFLNIY